MLRKKCPYSELFWSAFSHIRTEYGEIRSISPYLVQMRENADQNNSEYGNFSRSDNNTSFMSKELRKSIMFQSKLKNDFNKNRFYENWCKYNGQQNLSVNLLIKTKGKLFRNLNENNLSDSRTFWKEIKPWCWFPL